MKIYPGHFCPSRYFYHDQIFDSDVLGPRFDRFLTEGPVTYFSPSKMITKNKSAGPEK
jgi:hypothetical protein